MGQVVRNAFLDSVIQDKSHDSHHHDRQVDMQRLLLVWLENSQYIPAQANCINMQRLGRSGIALSAMFANVLRTMRIVTVFATTAITFFGIASARLSYLCPDPTVQSLVKEILVQRLKKHLCRRIEFVLPRYLHMGHERVKHIQHTHTQQWLCNGPLVHE